MSENTFMKAIGENLNVINKRIGQAFKDKDAVPIREMAERVAASQVDFIDINLGPARKGGEELMTWVVETVQEVTDIPLCLDTSNVAAMTAGLKVCKKKAIMNSIMARPERYEVMLPICAEYGANMIALMWGPNGMARDANERAELVTELMMAAQAHGIPMADIWVDPIVTPVNIQQEQLMNNLGFFDMLPDIAAAIDPEGGLCKSTNGLSNVSNGNPDHLRPILNQTYMIMLQRKGMYSSIVDAFDPVIMDICRGKRQDIVDLVYGVMDGKEYDYSGMDKEAVNYIKTAKVILGHSLFSESWLDVD
jgi:5-methyltetrahydrofolate corrinoid/iron sulfur protein methyltransferase